MDQLNTVSKKKAQEDAKGGVTSRIETGQHKNDKASRPN
jgi:hypothetical protein